MINKQDCKNITKDNIFVNKDLIILLIEKLIDERIKENYLYGNEINIAFNKKDEFLDDIMKKLIVKYKNNDWSTIIFSGETINSGFSLH